MSKHPQSTDNRDKLARVWLICISVGAAMLFAWRMLGSTQMPGWLAVIFGMLAIGAFLVATVASPRIRKAVAGFLAWPFS